MKLSGLHLLLTYQCTFECDHCFVWGSPWQTGTFTLPQIRHVLQQGQAHGVKSVYLEGGEPFFYYATLLAAAREAHRMGFSVGVVTNSYWATSVEDALEYLRPFVGLVGDLSISSDLYHYSQKLSQQANNARVAAEQLGFSTGVISIAQVEEIDAARVTGQLPASESGVMYRGRAADKLAAKVEHPPWQQFAECPHEDLRDPGRVHVDPLGYLHVCQGISMGNIFRATLSEICAAYDPEAHPIVGPLLHGGPAELVRRYELAHEDTYADACHLCYLARSSLRERFPDSLGPDQMYGVIH